MLVKPLITNDNGVWVHENVLDTDDVKTYIDYLESFLGNRPLNIEKRVLNVNNTKVRLGGFNEERSYTKVWDMSLDKDYWHQNSETIVDWSQKYLRKNISPNIRRLISKIQTLQPLGSDYIPYRGIFNHLTAGTGLGYHIDGDMYLYDLKKVHLYSATTYFQMCEEGGEFWNEHGLIFKPAVGTVLINVSDGIIHGVTPGNGRRLGITIRFVHKNDLVLPGHPDLLLYKPLHA